ncbi:cell division protein PerM [Okibacterium fritillariae]|uniref:Uncharacterized protein n=1 Tax=Okibacterium fritillariae TaxID=123320 RepID=A0A1T5IT19_9MICO|nr:DUF6350 family protein [Okibacterium fritillariae]SKC42300.1 hypothetical protein SAMN06309945_0824 [Okibacterium fritillariae]
MNRSQTATLAALETLIAIAIGVAIPLVPLSLLWAIQDGFATDWLVFWRAAVDIWLAGNGVDIRATADAATIAQVGVAQAAQPFFVTIAPLAFALFSVLAAVRIGRRAAETRYWQSGVAGSLVAALVLSALLTFSALSEQLRPSILQGIVLPPLVIAVGLAIGVIRHRVASAPSSASGSTVSPRASGARSGAAKRSASAGLGERIADRFSDTQLAILRAGFTGATAVVAAILAVASVLLALTIFANFGTITTLYESTQLGVTGGIAVTLGQLAFMPNLVIWVASWLVGPGFALGAGTSVSPVNTVVGPLPAFPILGAVPTADLLFGFVGILVPLLAGFFAAMLVRERLTDAATPAHANRTLAAGAVAIGLISALIFAVLASLSGGAIGPGRLAEVGPNPLWVALFVFIEVTVAALIGMLASGHSDDHPDTGSASAASGRSRLSERESGSASKR